MARDSSAFCVASSVLAACSPNSLKASAISSGWILSRGVRAECVPEFYELEVALPWNWHRLNRLIKTPGQSTARSGRSDADKDLAVQDADPAVGSGCPVPPCLRDLMQLVASGHAGVHELLGNSRAHDAVGPHATPLGA